MQEHSDKDTITFENNENIVLKYELLREKIIKQYNHGCKILDITKAVIAAAFILFTVIAVLISGSTGHKMSWLVIWIMLIFLNVGIFLITDYCKYLVKSKVIPYLEDDNQIEFGEYSIFMEDEEEDEA